MQLVIFAGGLGTRISEETDYVPKPMVKIGKQPILWHIIKYYSMFGFSEFIICGGYKVNIIIPKTILKSELQQEIEDCLVCLTNISNIYTSCFHLYCKDCIIKWLDKNTTCPYCRSVISINDLMMII